MVRKLKIEGNWLASGIPIMSDYAIAQKLVALNDDFKAVNKSKHKAKSDKRDVFKKNLEALFDISSPDVLDKIQVGGERGCGRGLGIPGGPERYQQKENGCREEGQRL